MSSGYRVKRLDEIAGYGDPARSQWYPIRAELGIRSLGSMHGAPAKPASR